MQPRLIYLSGPAAGIAVNLPVGEISVGREEGNALVLQSSLVSRRHARIVPSANGYIVEDLASSNGVTVNGLRIGTPTLLRSGDEIGFGDEMFRFENAAQTLKSAEVSHRENAQALPPLSSSSRSAGCNVFGSMLSDLSGLMPMIMRFVPWIFGILVAVWMISLLVHGVGALFQSASGNSHPSTPGKQQKDGADDSRGDVRITILSTSVVTVVNPKGERIPTLLVRWVNDSDQPVRELDGTVTLHLANGKTSIFPKVKLYSGEPVAPKQIHSDLGTRDGAAIETSEDPTPEVTPTAVK